ncbi:cupredoxin domain-containing protein [Pseudomonas sp. SA3-5]|uniref:Cupredoxin domain-containing protein n=1 Tax=Pseudomonas aestuarii TaxID=3018340 RepID=A0ABT4XDT6_9PSED|nr:cupredoxin domain-containing protein [Pseudomonas aestuarii]MDA7086366.1 cupredoxin domain-containing protein [Pseudomonas aestuarii]
MPRSLLVLLGVALGLPLSAVAASLPTYRLEMRDGHFTPANLEVPAGRRFKIVLHNQGQGPAEFESTPLRVEKVMSPGVESFVVIHPLRPGRYAFFDEFHRDLAEGAIVAQ